MPTIENAVSQVRGILNLSPIIASFDVKLDPEDGSVNMVAIKAKLYPLSASTTELPGLIRTIRQKVPQPFKLRFNFELVC